MKIIAFDPGEITGMVSYDSGLLGKRIECLATLEFSTWRNIDSRLYNQTRVGLSDIVVVERPFKSLRANPISFEVFGVIKERAFYYGYDVVIQEAGIPSYIYNKYDFKIQFAGLKYSQHIKDAFCHLINCYENAQYNTNNIQNIIELFKKQGAKQYD